MNHYTDHPVDYYDTIPGFWDAADAVELWLESHPGLHNPSSIARGAKIDRNLIYQVLAYMDRHRYIAAEGNGCWRKYGAFSWRIREAAK